MHGLYVVRMVVSAGASHSFWLSVVRHDVATVVKFMVANGTFPSLLDDLSVQQLPHLSWRTEFAISPRVMRIFDTLNTKLKSAFFPRLVAPAAEPRTVDWAVFIPSEFHARAPVCWLKCWWTQGGQVQKKARMITSSERDCAMSS